MFTTPQDSAGGTNRNFAELANMEADDTVIVNYGGLVAVGTVLGKGQEAPMQTDFAVAANAAEKTDHWKKGMTGLRVEVQLDLLPAKVRYQDFNDDIQREQASIPKDRDRPFRREGDAKQSTFWYLTAQLGELLLEICGKPAKGAASRVKANVPPPPRLPRSYVPQFETREARPEQSAFRQLMLEIWGGRCPISGTRHPKLLEAAHFKNWRHHNGADAGMLLDSRVHAALDAQLLTVTLDENSNTWSVKVHQEAWDDLSSLDGKMFANPIPMT